jgi:hypothetical protein
MCAPSLPCLLPGRRDVVQARFRAKDVALSALRGWNRVVPEPNIICSGEESCATQTTPKAYEGLFEQIGSLVSLRQLPEPL